MAITFDEIWDGREMTDDLEQDIQEYVRVWRAFTDDPLIGQKTVREEAVSYIDLNYTDYYGDDDESAWTRKVQVRQDQDDPRFWVVLATYSNAVASDPLDDDPEISIDYEPYQRPFLKHRTGAQAGLDILNGASDPFDPPITGDDDRWTYRCSRNESLLIDVPLRLSEFNGHINSDEWNGKEAGTLKMRCSAILQSRNGTQFWKVTYVIQERKDIDEDGNTIGWQPHVLNRGYRYLDGGDATKRVEFRERDGTRASQPRLLASDGAALAATDPPSYVDAEIYYEADFNDLGLPFP